MRQRNIHFYPAHAVVDAAIDEFFGSVFSNPKAGSKYPFTDVYTKEGIAYLEIAVAGFSKDEIKIELTEDSLRIVGSKQEENVADREYIKRDIAKRNFDVAYSLMFPVDHIEAEIVDGILKVVVVPANKQKEVRQIEIK